MTSEAGRKLTHQISGGQGREIFGCQDTSLLHRVTKFLLLFLSRFSNVDLEAERNNIHRKPGPTNQAQISKGTDPSAIRKSNKSNKIISRMVMVMFFLSSLVLLVGTYHHYVYDITRIKLEHFNSSKSSSQLGKLAALAKALNGSRAQLDQMRAPYLDGPHFAVSCAYILVLLISFVCYCNGAIYFNYISSFDLWFVRMILDQESEQINCQRMVKIEVDRFLKSARAFLEYNKQIADLCQKHRLSWNEGAKSATGSLMMATTKPCKLNELVRLGNISAVQLDFMQNNLLLYPINRSSGWVKKISVQFCMLSLSNITYSFLFDVCLVYLFPKLIFNMDVRTGPTNLLWMFDIIIVAQIGVISLTFYWCLFIADASDQIRCIQFINETFFNCININEFLFANIRPVPPNGLNPNHLGDVVVVVLVAQTNTRMVVQQELNYNLLLTWMRYRMFVAQLRPMQQSFAHVASTALFFLFTPPFIMRLHLPYAGFHNRPVLIYMSVVVLVFVDYVLFFISQIHSRGVKLYKALFSLAAHAVRCLEAEGETGGPIYDKHLVWLVCKELQHPERLANQFATESFGAAITYPTLVQIHYWYSIIIVSCFCELQSWRDIVGQRLDDPFGLLK